MNSDEDILRGKGARRKSHSTLTFVTVLFCFSSDEILSSIKVLKPLRTSILAFRR